MKPMSLIVVALLAALVLTGCMSPGGKTPGEQRYTARKMAADGLNMLYEKNPELQEKVVAAAGYGVYKNLGVNVLIPSTETGWGVVHNNRTGKDTYMKLLSIGLGLGIGVRDFRAILIFDTQESINAFLNSGWGGNGQANAAFRFGDVGDSAAVAAEVMPGVKIYKYTVNGVVLQATFQGSKTWKNDKLDK
jgi:lipid-binding SYLF domain-containing protein